jgi:nucleotide-binding universal stress UspA family protein
MNDTTAAHGGGSRRARIVVGVDGSGQSMDALRWAVQQAEVTGAEVRAIMCWDVPASAAWAPMADLAFMEKATVDQLNSAIEEALGPDKSGAVTPVVTEGRPSHVLLGESAEADLLVVGASGRGAFVGMLLGSVTDHVVSHASCSVVVVRSKPK